MLCCLQLLAVHLELFLLFIIIYAVSILHAAPYPVTHPFANPLANSITKSLTLPSIYPVASTPTDPFSYPCGYTDPNINAFPVLFAFTSGNSKSLACG